VGQFEKCSGGCPQPLSVIIEKTAEDSRRYIINKIKLAHYHCTRKFAEKAVFGVSLF
jgi:hypothetical protein